EPGRYRYRPRWFGSTAGLCGLVILLLLAITSSTDPIAKVSPSVPLPSPNGSSSPAASGHPPIAGANSTMGGVIEGKQCTFDNDCGPSAECRKGLCYCKRFLRVPNTSRKYFTPPSLTCQQGLDAMTRWWLDSVRYSTVAIHLAIALWPAHQLLAVSFTFVRLSIAKGLFRLRVVIYVTVFGVCVGRIISYGFDPFGFENVRHTFASCQLSRIATGYCGPSASSSATASSAMTAAHHSHGDERPPWHSSSSHNDIHNGDHQRPWSHALALYWWCKFAFYFVNALLWAIEITFLFVLSEDDLSKITSAYAVGSMCLLVVVSALLVIGVNFITRRFEACQPPPLRLDDILLVPYKPGETSILDVTVRARATPVQPLPTRVARSCTAVMLISAIVRLLVSNPKLYPAGTADLWLGFQAIVRFIEAAAVLLIMYGVAVVPDPLDDPRTPVSPTAMESSFAQHRMSKRPRRQMPPMCPFLAMQGSGTQQRRAPGSGSPWELPTSPSATPRALAPVHLTPVSGARTLGSSPVAGSSGSVAGLPSAHTFEQQFLWAYGRQVSDTAASPVQDAGPLARSPPPLHHHHLHNDIGPALGARNAPPLGTRSGAYVNSAALARAATLATAAGALNLGQSHSHHVNTASGSGYHQQRQTWIRPPAARVSESGTGSSGEAEGGGPWSGRHRPVGW
ncbi:hypothetical protein BCR44DRAFT_1440731, partial [Catenaria anguillulae PL171]